MKAEGIPVLDAGKHRDLPGKVAGEQDDPPASCDRPIDMFEAVRLHPPARFEDTGTPSARSSSSAAWCPPRSNCNRRFVLPEQRATIENMETFHYSAGG
jgi:hypothetical protein